MNWNAFDEAPAEQVEHAQGLTPEEEAPVLTEEDVRTRRLKTCLENFPGASSGAYDPRCCRFPKSCSPHAYIEAYLAGNLTDDDLEPKR